MEIWKASDENNYYESKTQLHQNKKRKYEKDMKLM